MQVHAVPDSERALTSTGRRLPWAYEFADSDHTQRRIPEEKGPFGKARKRGLSRSKTATPARGQDQAKLENLRVIDDIFSKTKQQEAQRESLRTRKPSGPNGSLPISASAPNLIDAAGLDSSLFQGNGSTAAPKEPTEVILWGYGPDQQWAAIDFYEKVSGGIIYEDYDRLPPNTRYNLSLSQHKASSVRSLSKASLRKLNEYVGGDHWIKVTFDSPEAAERACHYSPKVIQGHIVTAQRYVGRGPPEDKAVRASPGSAVASLAGSPNASSSSTLPFGTSSSATASSATATTSVPASMPQRLASEPFLRSTGAFPIDDDETLIPQRQAQPPAPTNTTSTSVETTRQAGRSTLRVKGAKAAVLLPAEKAFLPAPSPWQQTFRSWPVIGWIVGTNHGIIGDQVPRKEDGSFDSANASLYWRMWYNIDSCFGTNFCGVRDAEYED
ncbi:uncharacterized protein EI97DRAFT_416717 [Westerdykella ornata]|uniref:Uncharacterized protein n=1 Tax=Westerdykella ornata TaxID=318751 RepID=A0A6A6JLU6_WESOR|nr:uncharacterized protein EI97DRAFT_416717 [Westerdykella ornata]KAF2277640.1 hypothetical protein EI97DRAFT_416717 [Westerdykella ornata]